MSLGWKVSRIDRTECIDKKVQKEHLVRKSENFHQRPLNKLEMRRGMKTEIFNTCEEFLTWIPTSFDLICNSGILLLEENMLQRFDRHMSNDALFNIRNNGNMRFEYSIKTSNVEILHVKEYFIGSRNFIHSFNFISFEFPMA